MADKKMMADLLENAESAERFLKEIANAKRLMVLCTLMDQEMSVAQLNALIPLSQSALSQHLGRLREAGFVRTRKEAQTVYYRLADERVARLLPVFYEMFCA
ncbi:MAG: transcriptional regulator [Oleiphilus sp.]|nr:MAG: transcriptional regulator [Oleiphilus sp.]